MFTKTLEITLDPKNFKGKQGSDIATSHSGELFLVRNINENGDTLHLVWKFFDGICNG